MTESRHPDGRPRDSIAAAAMALSRLGRLGRLRDLPVILMLAWVGWLAIPWPSSGLVHARSATTQPQDGHAGATVSGAGLPPAPPVSTARVFGAELSGGGVSGTDVPASWGLNAAPVRPALLVKPGKPAKLDKTAEPNKADKSGEPDTSSEAGTSSESARELIALERARIAGEVHDVAGHGLATIAMQAGIALLVFDERPDQVRESLEAIRSTSVLALDQLRSALDLIAPETGPEIETAPEPETDPETGPEIENENDPGVAPESLADHDLPRLIDGVRAAGVPVDVEPAAPDVPAHLEGVVYRVVRESLTNVLRHAGPTRALVRVTGDPHAFVLEVADRGSGPPATAAEGRGLAGMRVRVAEAGGTFGAGPREGGGFRVVARFPLETV
ncbi:histidine kinase [Streptosporangium sp. NPDC002524]|uniref:sensor histidine kinase n=1 Tax=Streptosporangium sp. NPDC002524 TaxID=3154537 RepID=UPI0033194119